MTKYIFITGGVVSSLGKGIAASSLAAILESRGLKITMTKLDPYINVDPGTMSPFQHGEVFVTEDGTETDLDLGHGPDGADLLTKVFKERPWTGMVIMTAHASPELAINDASRIPDPTVYIVKSQLQSMQYLVSALEESISKTGNFQSSVIASEEKITITSSQAEILRMIADGLSNASIAEARGITLRAAEALIQRTFAALGVNGDPSVNPRVVAVRMWHQGKVAVK